MNYIRFFEKRIVINCRFILIHEAMDLVNTSS